MGEYLFSYGTLQKEKVQLRLFGRRLTGTEDILAGHKLLSIEVNDMEFLSSGEKPTQLTLVISEDRGDCIEGTVFEITAQELALADRYEPDEYQRVRVELGSGKSAWVYAATEIS